jgi:hypothetical protein
MDEEEAAIEAYDSDDNDGVRSADEDPDTGDEGFIDERDDLDVEDGEYVPPGGIKRKTPPGPPRCSKRNKHEN